MLDIEQKRVRLKEMQNYGSSTSPLYTIALAIEIAVRESPDLLHKIFTGTGLITRETVPFDVVSNFRGSADNKPFYSADILHEGMLKKYEVRAKDTGGSPRTGIRYEPEIYPAELRLVHPAEFYRLEIEVKGWELHNYRHYFMRFIASTRYESFDMVVKSGVAFTSTSTSILINIAESELKLKQAPCSWYLERLSIFPGLDLEEEVMQEVKHII